MGTRQSTWMKGAFTCRFLFLAFHNIHTMALNVLQCDGYDGCCGWSWLPMIAQWVPDGRTVFACGGIQSHPSLTFCATVSSQDQLFRIIVHRFLALLSPLFILSFAPHTSRRHFHRRVVTYPDTSTLSLFDSSKTFTPYFQDPDINTLRLFRPLQASTNS